MIRAALALFLMCSPVWATQDSWPALYDVTGVAADDVLNVRRGADAGSDIIGTLPPDATNVEVVRPNDLHMWGLVNFGETTGWVSLAFLARQPGQWVGQYPEIRSCFGTEPFWSMDVEGPAALFSTPDAPGEAGLISEKVASDGRRDRFAYRGTILSPDSGPLNLTVMLRTEICGDGMSDRTYGIATDVLITDPNIDDGQRATILHSGCCSLLPPAR